MMSCARVGMDVGAYWREEAQSNSFSIPSRVDSAVASCAVPYTDGVFVHLSPESTLVLFLFSADCFDQKG